MSLIKRIKLIPDWKEAWKFFSVQLAFVMIFLDILQANMPQLQPFLPDKWVSYISLAIIVTRLIHQNVKAFEKVTTDAADKS